MTLSDLIHAERDHAEHSPSSLKFKEVCPGWESQQDDDRFQGLADEGSLMHAAAETGDLSKLDVSQRHFVRNVLDYVERATMGAVRVIKEERLYHADPLLREKAHGTPDQLAFMDDAFVHLIDYKFGRRPVDHASENLQGWAYVLAVFDTYPEVQFVHVHFLAPRLADGFTNHVFERGDYDRLLKRVKGVVELAEWVIANGYPYDSLHPNLEACLYCGLRATCRPLIDTILPIMTHTDETIDAGAVEAALAHVDNENEEELSLLFKFAKVAKAWAEAYERHALNKHLNEGLNIDGYELRFRKGRTTISDTPKATATLCETAGLDVDTILKACDLNLKKLETLLTTDVEEDQIPEVRQKISAALAQAGVVKTSEETQYLYKLNRDKKHD